MTDGQSPIRPQQILNSVTPTESLAAGLIGVVALLLGALPLLGLWTVLIAVAGLAAILLTRHDSLPALTMSGVGVAAMLIGALLSPDLARTLTRLLWRQAC